MRRHVFAFFYDDAVNVGVRPTFGFDKGTGEGSRFRNLVGRLDNDHHALIRCHATTRQLGGNLPSRAFDKFGRCLIDHCKAIAHVRKIFENDGKGAARLAPCPLRESGAHAHFARPLRTLDTNQNARQAGRMRGG